MRFNNGSVCRRLLATKSRLYTRTGDRGHSSLYTGERRPKTHAVFRALGSLDELNCALGVTLAHCRHIEPVNEQLPVIQSRLMDVASHVATPPPPADSSENSLAVKRRRRTQLNPGLVDQLEQWIDHLDSDLPPLKNFILPGGSLASAQAHVSRAAARRAERAMWLVNDHTDSDDPPLDDIALQYCNRLSDYLFAAARFVNAAENGIEIIYKS